MIPKYIIPPNQFASADETRAGTADNKAVTPRALNAALRNLGLIPNVMPSFNSFFMRIDLANTPSRPSPPPVTGCRALLSFPDGSAHPVIKMDGTYEPNASSLGQVTVYISVMVGDTVGYIPVFMDAHTIK